MKNSIHEMRCVSGEEWTKENNLASMARFDTDKDGYITLHEFLEFWRHELSGLTHDLFEQAIEMFSDMQGKHAG